MKLPKVSEDEGVEEEDEDEVVAKEEGAREEDEDERAKAHKLLSIIIIIKVLVLFTYIYI